MDIPDLVKGALDGEEIQAGVSLGDEDAVCLTPTRTLVYRGEGLLSDEAVEEYSHDIEQLAVSEGRRKTKFTMQYIDGTQSFTVPANRGDKVLELFLEGVLKLAGVIDARESLAGVYRFSELTLIIAEGRLIKHIGSQVWSEDYEVYAYDDVTGLEFERASVATSIALSVGGRPQRVKVPNDKAPVVRQTLEEALFGYYDVANVDELNRVVGPETDAGGVDPADEAGGDDFAFGDDFDPLVSDDANLAESVDADDRLAESDPSTGRPSGEPERQPTGQSTDPAAGQPADASAGEGAEPATRGSDANAESAAAGDSRDRAEQSAQKPSTEPELESEPTETPEPDAGAGDVRQSEGATGAPAEADTSRDDADPRDQRARSQQADSQRASSQQPEPQRAGSQRTASRDADATDRASESARRGDASADHTADAAAAPDDASESGAPTESTAAAGSAGADESEPAPVTREEFEAMAERLDELTDAVDRQNELLKRQHRALKQLVQQRDSE
ncbi:hypothetical protein C475_17073 [Halosimplex carlsbadense 2-9-1]|uniref:DUF7115 domain-containing protein n=1 Tax=Halosimplex carlsbadense 2-9-1 TaxID=797114 RepID=M0CG46_9EURY|nr:hypothetical protein [Halosimplex carlsbadense]ELZ22245.1 hypothetical protein C475_17073 [Halosimplex carlsbadense 2-9-1]